jgi:hypothetical protein
VLGEPLFAPWLEISSGEGGGEGLDLTVEFGSGDSGALLAGGVDFVFSSLEAVSSSLSWAFTFFLQQPTIAKETEAIINSENNRVYSFMMT